MCLQAGAHDSRYVGETHYVRSWSKEVDARQAAGVPPSNSVFLLSQSVQLRSGGLDHARASFDLGCSFVFMSPEVDARPHGCRAGTAHSRTTGDSNSHHQVLSIALFGPAFHYQKKGERDKSGHVRTVMNHIRVHPRPHSGSLRSTPPPNPSPLMD